MTSFRIALLAGGACVTSMTMALGTTLQPRMGDPLLGLTSQQLESFLLGRDAFERNISVEEGLGPVFNQTSCASCHNNPVGGAGAQQVTRFGRLDKKGGFDPLASFGGSLLNANAISDDCLDEIPAMANVTSLRVTPGALGYGLIEAIPDDQFVAVSDAQAASVRGDVRWVEPLESPGTMMVGRFGWKAQVGTILTFSADASNQELGFTTRLLPNDNPPRGDFELLLECDMVADPEDVADAGGVEYLDRVTIFQRLLAPPPQTPPAGMAGEVIFTDIGCTSCHHATYVTGDGALLEEVLRNQTIHPYGDFLLHDMGQAADGIADGPAGVRQLRTPPLWGLRTRNPMWHDGRILGGSFEDRAREAIALHGAALSQGQAVASAFEALSLNDQDALLVFLDSLGRAEFDATGDGGVDLDDFYDAVGGCLVCLGGDVMADDVCSRHDVDVDGDVDLDDVGMFAVAFDDGWVDCDENGVGDFVQIASDPSVDGDQNGVLDDCESCPADVDGSGTVGIDDLLAVIAAWAPCAKGCDEDVDGDLFVGVNDLLAVVAAWGPCE
jgi:CxxC motif-containing protein (DUF1111 family)